MKLNSLLNLVFCIGVAFNLHAQILPAAFGVATPSRPVARTVVTSGLVLNLDASNASSYPGSGTTWTDLSSSGNNGTLTNGPTYSSSNGGSLVFDGSNDFVSFSSGLPSTDNLTYEAWVNPSVLNGFGVILMPDNWIAGNAAFEFDGNLLQFALNGESDKYSTYTFNTNNWYQIAVVYSKSAKTISFYVNGSLTNTENYNNPSTVSNTTLKIGAWDGSSRFFNGNIGQIRIYNQSLTTAEVLQNYNALRPRFLSIGDSYGGGKVAYILQSGDPGYDAATQHGLIAASSDQSTGIRWYNGGSFTATGAVGTTIGTGFANTNTIITSQGATATSYAAGLARAYTGGGYTDWYLPSKNELNKLYENRVAIGGFLNRNYWSSSEWNYEFVWSQDFLNGSWNYYGKEYTNIYVRAIRAF